MRDEEIIELYWRRSEDAIRATAAKYGGYCGSIAVNILSRGGGEAPAALEELGECVPAVPGADQAVEDRELERIMDRFLHTLPPRDCNVFLRRYWYAEPLEAIAKRYGMKVSTVKTCLYRSRGKLRYYLEGEGIFL